MKISDRNPPGEHESAIVRGHIGPNRAGSSGLASVSDGRTSASGVEWLRFIGAKVIDGGGTAIVSILGEEISPTALSGNTNDWDPVDATDTSLGRARASVIRMASGAAYNLTGIVAPGDGDSGWIELANISAYTITLKHDATSTAANRFYCPNDVDLALQKDSSALLWYDATSARWRVAAASALSGGISGFATPSIALGSSAAAGSATTVIRSDATIAAFDATAPSTQALGDSAAAGSAAVAARRDHKHAMPAAAVTSSGLTMATARILGRTTASSGAVEEVSVGTGLSMSSGVLSATGSGGGATAYFSRRLLASSANADNTFNVNTASYINTAAMGFYHDWDLFPATHFLISAWAYSNETSQTVTLQLATNAAPGTPYSSGGNDLVVTRNGGAGQFLSSGWIAVASIPTGLILMTLGVKGSTATVDLIHRFVDVTFKIA